MRPSAIRKIRQMNVTLQQKQQTVGTNKMRCVQDSDFALVNAPSHAWLNSTNSPAFYSFKYSEGWWTHNPPASASSQMYGSLKNYWRNPIETWKKALTAHRQKSNLFPPGKTQVNLIAQSGNRIFDTTKDASQVPEKLSPDIMTSFARQGKPISQTNYILRKKSSILQTTGN